MTLVRVGRIGRAHGVQGEVGLVESSLTPLELLGVKRYVWRGLDGAERPLTMVTARPAHARMLVRFEGVETPDQAAPLVRGELMAHREALPDPGPGMAYTFQLVGLAVRTEDGRPLGTLEAVWPSGAHPIYVVRGADGKELLLPAIPQVVKRVDLAARTMIVEPPAGIEDL